MFSELLLAHFQHPRNVGELPGADIRVEVSNPVCGDVLQLAVKLDGGRIREVRFLCRGCTAAIACASLLTEQMHGAELRALRLISSVKISELLGGLPPASLHGAQLAEDGVKALLSAVSR
jgi:nitrogen fixation NifU-like protein